MKILDRFLRALTLNIYYEERTGTGKDGRRSVTNLLKKRRMSLRSKIAIGVDIGAYNHSICVMDANARQVYDELFIEESRSGYSQLDNFLRGLLARFEGCEFHLGAEATGVYWRNLFHFLHKEFKQVKLSLINPLQTKRFFQMNLVKTKTDKVDSRLIANYVAINNPQESKLFEHEMEDLSEICRYRKIKLKEYSRYRNYLHKYLKESFPEVLPRLKRFSGKKELAVLTKYPTAKDIRQAEASDIANITYTQRNWKVGTAFAEEIKKQAASSIGCYQGPGVRFSIQSLAANCLRLQAEIEAFNQKIEEIYGKNPSSALVSLPGIGALSAAVIESEIKSIHRFDSPKKLVGYVGCYPEIRQSGTSNLKTPKMTHKGNRYLNTTIFMCVLNSIAPNSGDNIIKSTYYRMISSGKDKMVAMGSCMRKLTHLIFVMLKTQKRYDPDYEFKRSAFDVALIDRRTGLNWDLSKKLTGKSPVVPIRIKRLTLPQRLESPIKRST